MKLQKVQFHETTPIYFSKGASREKNSNENIYEGKIWILNFELFSSEISDSYHNYIIRSSIFKNYVKLLDCKLQKKCSSYNDKIIKFHDENYIIITIEQLRALLCEFLQKWYVRWENLITTSWGWYGGIIIKYFFE